MSQVLIHIGYPKAGSSYLQNWFEAHPEMYYQNKAVAGFYNAHDISRYAQHAEKLHSFFVLSCEDLSVWKGDINVVGFKGKPYDIRKYHENTSRILKSIFPEAKMLIVTRGYESMFKSLYSQYVRGGGIFTFEELQNEYGAHFPVLYDYSYIIQLYRTVFGNENVLALPYELLKENPNRFTQIIEQKIGVEKSFSYTTEKANESLNIQTIDASRKISKFICSVIRPFPLSTQEKIFCYYVKNYLISGKNPFINFIARQTKNSGKLRVKSELLQAMKGRADILRHEGLFQPYLKDYLI